MPSSITFSDGSTVSYTYSADGTKLRTVHKIGGVTTTTDYCGNVIYENGVQKLLLTEEGYISLNDKKYHYFLKDHQGNNRVVVNQAGEVEETNHYYPFGGIFASNTTVQPYKYNDKELDTKKGLNWYDYGARHYDAMLGRFQMVDPLAEKYYAISPYGYCNNNSIRYVDPDGKKIVDSIGKEITYKDGIWSPNVTADVKKVGEAMMRNSVGLKQFMDMMSADHLITINIESKSSDIGRLGVTTVRAIDGKIEKAAIRLYTDAIQDMANTLAFRTKGDIVERYHENMSPEQLEKISFDDVLGATATHESVHALDERSNIAGESDKSKREINPVTKEIEYIKQITNY